MLINPLLNNHFDTQVVKIGMIYLPETVKTEFLLTDTSFLFHIKKFLTETHI